MVQPTLSILVPITPDRHEIFAALFNKITGFELDVSNAVKMYGANWHWRSQSEKYPEVEIYMIEDNREMTLGEKRELLYGAAAGKYSWQVDSDDDIADDAIPLILRALKNGPDCVTFEEKCLINGKLYCSNFSNRYQDWEGDGQRLLEDGFHFHRTVFYKCVVQTKLARNVPFQYIRYGEDYQWAKDLKPHIKTEVHIPKQLYHYIHNSKPEEHNERYGIQ